MELRTYEVISKESRAISTNETIPVSKFYQNKSTEIFWIKAV